MSLDIRSKLQQFPPVEAIADQHIGSLEASDNCRGTAAQSSGQGHIVFHMDDSPFIGILHMSLFQDILDGLPNDTVIYPHLRKGLLKNFLEYRKEHPLCDMDLLEYQLAAWNLIGQLMLNMGCCRNSEAIVG